jgi:acyl dehydratase/2-polyprenyl-3-methyl-5-hydroxy-6-metoxy-1,4-benzoquinol methylase
MFFEEFEVGQSWQMAPVHMTLEGIRQFAQEYDPLPFHIDEKAAQQTRFGGIIASGPHSFMAIWTAFVREHDPFGEQLIVGLSNHMSWPKPTYPGDTLFGEVTVVSAQKRSGKADGIIEIAVKATNQRQELILDGGARILMRAGQSFEEIISQQARQARGEGHGRHHDHGEEHGHHHGEGHDVQGHRPSDGHDEHGHHHGHGEGHGHRVCPPGVADVLISPERLKFHNPQELMRPYVTAGMTAVDVGCAKGFFTIPMLEMVGHGGRVLAIDLQPEMLEGLARAVSDEQAQRLIPLQCSEDDFKAQDYVGQADFVLMFWMLHEIEDTKRAVRQAVALLKPGGTLMLTEPDFRVDQQRFDACVEAFVAEGLELIDRPNIWMGLGAVLRFKHT